MPAALPCVTPGEGLDVTIARDVAVAVLLPADCGM
jgi:hypothetical protein